MNFPTPDISHLKRSDYEKIYEPDSDSFLLLDALELRYETIVERKASIVVEFGPGSGLATAFLGKYFSSRPIYFLDIEINRFACETTIRTFRQNGLNEKHSLDLVQSDLALCLIDRLESKVDLLIFNPPYVPSETSNVATDIERTFAGGENGFEVIQRAIEQAARLLSDSGLFYMVALEQNDENRIEQLARTLNLDFQVVLRRRTPIEHLIEIKMPKSKEFIEDSDSDEKQATLSDDEETTKSTTKKAKSKSSTSQENPPAKRVKKNDDEEESQNGVTIGPNGERLYEIGKMRFISVSQFKGKPYINIREYYDDHGVQKPGKKGISLAADQWDKLKSLVAQVDKDLKKSK